MSEIKFKYYFTNHGPVTFTLGQLESGCLDEASFNGVGKIIARKQYTGLKDKNGKEIYEGDILSVISGKHKRFVDIEWNEDETGWCVNLNDFMAPGSYWPSLGELLDEFSATIAGNIYENPELLTTTTEGGE